VPGAQSPGRAILLEWREAMPAGVPAYVAILDANGKVLARAELTPRDKKHPFSSGNVGYTATFKAALDGREHQIGVNAVAIK
jgi:hypothetical protein